VVVTSRVASLALPRHRVTTRFARSSFLYGWGRRPMAAAASRKDYRRHLAQRARGANVNVPTDVDRTLLISAEGYEQRCRELDVLRKDARRELSERLREARQDGDLADNLALQDLLEEQALLERRIALLDAQLAAAEIVGPAADGRAGIGTVVRIRDGDGATLEFELVGPLESDVSNGRVSIGTPVGQALVGQRAGARVEARTPRGPHALEVVSVRVRGVAEEVAHR
jgi:transcription elongation factor GreA